MRHKEKEEWLGYLYRKFMFAFDKCQDELRRRGMTEDELCEFVDDINTEFDIAFNGKELS